MFTISCLRDEVRTLADEIRDGDTLLFVSRLHELEAQALRLVDLYEAEGRVATHSA